MFDGIMDMFDGLIEKSISGYDDKSDSKPWQHCVALSRRGWLLLETNAVTDSDNVIVVWEKDGKKVNVKLDFKNQRLWLSYKKANRSSE